MKPNMTTPITKINTQQNPSSAKVNHNGGLFGAFGFAVDWLLSFSVDVGIDVGVVWAANGAPETGTMVGT